MYSVIAIIFGFFVPFLTPVFFALFNVCTRSWLAGQLNVKRSNFLWVVLSFFYLRIIHKKKNYERIQAQKTVIRIGLWNKENHKSSCVWNKTKLYPSAEWPDRRTYFQLKWYTLKWNDQMIEWMLWNLVHVSIICHNLIDSSGNINGK